MIWLCHKGHSIKSFKVALYAKSSTTMLSGYLAGHLRFLTLGTVADTEAVFSVASGNLAWAIHVEHWKGELICSPFQIDPRERSQLKLRAERESRLLSKR